MATINLYRMDSNRINQFKGELNASKLQEKKTITRSYEEYQFLISLYVDAEPDSNELSWNWILEQFDEAEISVCKAPRAIVLLEKKQENKDTIFYAVTFGSSYFVVDKYCDRDFGFKFACRIEYTDVKTTTLTSPGLKRNKTVNTYINYNMLEFRSGESYAKLKANMKLDDDFSVFRQGVEIGNSIHFCIDNETVIGIINVIIYVEDILKIPDDQARYKLPLFQQVKDLTDLQELDMKLDKVLEKAFIKGKDVASIIIPELEIVGTKEIFGHIDDAYSLKYLSKTESIDELSIKRIADFCKNNNVNTLDKIKKLKIVNSCNESKPAQSLISVIEYTDDEKKCIFSREKWYRFNDDYLTYLNESVDTVSACYNSQYDFNDNIHNHFIDEKYEIEKTQKDYEEKNKFLNKKDLKRKYYAERAFNLMRQEEGNFDCYDRKDTDSGYEKMDLYEKSTQTMFAVKIGGSSSDLCYAIDQSLTSFEMYKHGKLDNMPQIKCVGLWLILKKVKHLKINEDNNVKLSEINMIMLKNRIDQWIKEVRLAGYKPIVYINYREQNKKTTKKTVRKG